MTNWRTNLGGAISVLGTGLIGISVVPQLAGVASKLLLYCTVAGFVLSAVGKAVTALFAADAKSVAVAQTQIAELQLRSNIVPNAIESGDTSQLRRAPITPVVAPSAPVVTAGQPATTP
jgi:hypothetical protein